MSVASLVCGICGLFFSLAGIAGLVMGIIVLKKGSLFPISSRDRNFAITGVITGAISIFLMIVGLIFVFAMLAGLIALFNQLPELGSMG